MKWRKTSGTGSKDPTYYPISAFGQEGVDRVVRQLKLTEKSQALDQSEGREGTEYRQEAFSGTQASNY